MIFSSLIFFAPREGFGQSVALRTTLLLKSNVQSCYRNNRILFERQLLKQVWPLLSSNLLNLRFLCTFYIFRSPLNCGDRSNRWGKCVFICGREGGYQSNQHLHSMCLAYFFAPREGFGLSGALRTNLRQKSLNKIYVNRLEEYRQNRQSIMSNYSF